MDHAPAPQGGLSLAGRLRLVLVAVVVALLLNVAAAIALAIDIGRATTETDRTTEAQRAVDRLYRSLVDQQTAVQGFVVTADESLLVRFVRGQRDEQDQLTELGGLLGGDPVAIDALTQVERTAAAWRRDGAAPRITAVRAGGSAAEDPEVAEVVGSETGRRLFDEVRDDLDALRAGVDREAATALDDVRAAQRRTLWLLVGTLALTALLVVVGVRLTVSSLSRPLARLGEAVTEVAEGHLARRVPRTGPRELARLGDAAESMRQRLLEEGTAAARRSLLLGQEEERRRLASGIHDDTIQAAVAASLRMQRLRRRLDDTDPPTAKLVREAEADLAAAVARLRRLVFELHPPTLDDQGLASAMRLYLDETARPAGLMWQLRESGPDPQDDAARSLAYRLFREAVSNTVKHAHATRVDVRLDVNAGCVKVSVTDDGAGFDVSAAVEAVPGHLGLVSSRQLCAAAGGSWSVTSSPGRGTRVDYELPLAGS